MNDRDPELDLAGELFKELGIEDEKRAAMIMQAPQLIPQLESAIAEINRKLQIARDFIGQCDEKTQNFEAHKADLPSVIGYDSKIGWCDNTLPSATVDFTEWLDQGSDTLTVVLKIWKKIFENRGRMNNILSRFTFSSVRLASELAEMEGYKAWKAVSHRIYKANEETHFCAGCISKRPSPYNENLFTINDLTRCDAYKRESYLSHDYCDAHANALRNLYHESDGLEQYIWQDTWKGHFRDLVRKLRSELEAALQRELGEPERSRLEIEPILYEIKEQILLLRDPAYARIQELGQELIKLRRALDAVLAAISG